VGQETDARLAALEAEIAKLKAHVAATAGPPKSDRRTIVKTLAASALGATAGVAAFNAKSVAALDGETAKLGSLNTSTNATQFEASADVGVVAFGAPVGIVADGSYANALFPSSGPAPLDAPGSTSGVLFVDGAGDWWAAVADRAASNGPGLWRKLAGPATAGQLHILPSPKRVYDSRPTEAPTAVGPKTPLAGNTARTIDTTANASGVPVTATAVLVNMTITKPQAAGFATAWPAGPWPGTSNINFAAGQDIATTTVVGCGPNATIQIQANTITDFLLDVIGYYQ
jgi:hypothetical protein